MNLRNGNTIYFGGKSGVILRRQGAHAVKVNTTFARSVQDWASGRITEISGTRTETWPVARVTAEPPVVELPDSALDIRVNEGHPQFSESTGLMLA